MNTVIQFIGSGLGNGGAETLIKDYGRFLCNKGIRVVVVAYEPLNRQSGNYRQLTESGCTVLSLLNEEDFHKNPLLQKFWNHFVLKNEVKKRFLKIMKEYQPIVIHAHLNVLGTLKRMSSQLKGIKLFYTCHSNPKVHLNDNTKNHELSAAKYLIVHNGLRLIALHEEMCKELNDLLGITNSTIIWNGVNFSKFSNLLESKMIIRNSLSIPQEAFVVCHVGSFSMAKNHPFIIDVFSQICKRVPNAFLLLVGNGDCSNVRNMLNLNGLSGKYMILSNRSDVERMLKASDVFLFPSLYEGLPVSLVEAQIAGLRCVVSNTITESCFLFPTTIPLSLEESAEKWADVVLDSSMKSNCHHDPDVFNMENVIDNLYNLYLS